MNTTHGPVITGVHNPRVKRVVGQTHAERVVRQEARRTLAEIDLHGMTLRELAAAGVVRKGFWRIAGAVYPGDRRVCWRLHGVDSSGQRHRWSKLHADAGSGRTVCGLRIPTQAQAELRAHFSASGVCTHCQEAERNG